MNRDYYTNSNDYINRWVISYADFVTMLLALFMMLFDPGSAIIKSEAKAKLDKIALSLEAFTNPVVIEGHTDSMPIKNEKYPSNWELSTARATNIISYLTQTKKFPPGRLSAVGYGEYMPVDKNDNPAGRAKNRRVDIVIMSSVK